jgi:hypothetical protein
MNKKGLTITILSPPNSRSISSTTTVSFILFTFVFFCAAVCCGVGVDGVPLLRDLHGVHLLRHTQHDGAQLYHPQHRQGGGLMDE